MSVTLVYDTQISRVRIDADALDGTGVATYAVVDRTIDDVTFTIVRGGTAWPVSSGAFDQVLDDYEFPANQLITYRVRSFDASDTLLTTQTQTITAELQDVWLKSVARPFLNRIIIIAALDGPDRPSRSGVFDVVGRSFPVVVAEQRASRRFTLTVQTTTRTEAEDLDFALAAGDLMFLHVPPDFEDLHIPSMHVIVDSTIQTRINPHASATHRFALPMVEVAAPAPTVFGTTITWQGVINTYATWQDVINDQLTWEDVLSIVGSPSDVIVP